LAGSNLTRSHEQVLLELQTHDFIFLTTITETADDLAKQFPAFQVLGINQGDAICTVKKKMGLIPFSLFPTRWVNAYQQIRFW
jgi:hypothetical protein